MQFIKLGLAAAIFACSIPGQSCNAGPNHTTAGISGIPGATPGCDEISGPLSFSAPRPSFTTVSTVPLSGGNVTFTVWNRPGQNFSTNSAAGFVRLVFPSPYMPGVRIPGTTDPNCLNHVGPFNGADFGFVMPTWLVGPQQCFSFTVPQMIPPNFSGFPIGAQLHVAQQLNIGGDIVTKRWTSNPLQIVVQ